MTVRNGREFLSIPGPTTVPDAVLNAMHRPAVDIYSGRLVELTDGLLADLKKIFRTQGNVYIYASNGHGAWEAAVTNVLSRGDKILVLESGRFAVSWGENARRMGVEVEILKGDMRRAVRPSEVEARLRADKGGTIKAILVAQIDTASGVVNDIEAIGQAMRAAGHDALLMVDADRFKLVTHREVKEQPVYALVIAKSGLKLTESKPDDTHPDGAEEGHGNKRPNAIHMSRGHLTAQTISMPDLEVILTQITGRTVLDKTGLKGNYDVTLNFAPVDGQPTLLNGVPQEETRPSIFTALQEQLGLKLDSQKAPVEVLVIDHVERPSEN